MGLNWIKLRKKLLGCAKCLKFIFFFFVSQYLSTPEQRLLSFVSKLFCLLVPSSSCILLTSSNHLLCELPTLTLLCLPWYPVYKLWFPSGNMSHPLPLQAKRFVVLCSLPLLFFLFLRCALHVLWQICIVLKCYWCTWLQPLSGMEFTC